MNNDINQDQRLMRSVNKKKKKVLKPKTRTVDSYSAANTYNRRRLANMNRGLVIFFCVLAALAVLSIFLIILHPWTPTEGPANATTTASATTPATTAGDPEVPEGLKCTYLTVNSKTIHQGYQILINQTHPFSFATSFYKLTSLNASIKEKDRPYILWDTFEMEEKTLEMFNRLMNDFAAATGCKRTLVNSVYRSYEDQQEVYKAKGPALAITPGCSEHHSGMAIDMQIYDANYGDKSKKSWYFSEYKPAAWLVEHFADYGFILRYPDDKLFFTNVPTPEPWHYRYVGIPHAAVINNLGYCMEEYITYLQTLSFIGTRLYWDGSTAREIDCYTRPESGYLIYYVPASNGETTDLPILESAAEYEISGDNERGFIVTVKL